MANAIWKGTISFGLVSVPVELHPAAQAHSLSLSMLDKRDFAPVGYKRYNKATGADVPWDDVVKGYEYAKGQYVVLSDEDFRRANVRQARTLDIATFVDAGSIPPQHFETPYYLVPGDRGKKVYALLREAMRAAGKVGVGQVVIRTTQHLAALVPIDAALMMITLRYAHELVAQQEFAFPPPSAKGAGVTGRELELARKLIDDMSGPWKADAFADTYNDDLQRRIDEKIRQGEAKLLTQPGDDGARRRSAEVIDLMELLKKSIDNTRGHAPRIPRKRSRNAA